ncbi:hypothetical protein ABZ611_08925, partial [Streptomyces sp. NPDC007861]
MTGSGVPGDNGGVPGGVVVELAWCCHVDALDLGPLMDKGGLTQVVVEFDGTAADATAATPLVDADGVHAPPAFPWTTVLAVALGTAAAAALLIAARRLRRSTRRFQAAAAGALAPSFLAPQAAVADDATEPAATATATVEGTVFKDANGNGKRDRGERPMPG